MEIQFQKQQKAKMSKLKARNNNNKFVGVRQRPSGRWVAEIKDTTQKIRMWLGTFETAEAAARAYDEAACLLRGSNTRTNFVTHVSQNSPLASRIRNLLNTKKGTEKEPSLDTTTGTSSSIKTTTSTTSITSTSSTSNSTSCWTTTSNSTTSSTGDFSASEKINHQSQLFDDAYKPDLSHCNDGFDLSTTSCQSNNMSWGFANNKGIDRFPFAQEMLDLPKNMNLMAEANSTEMEFSEFDRMKVERQISASLYAMNGVQEYMDTVYDPNNEAIWDLPPLCSLFC